MNSPTACDLRVTFGHVTARYDHVISFGYCYCPIKVDFQERQYQTIGDLWIEEMIEMEREGEGPSWAESDETGPGSSKWAGLEPLKWEGLERESLRRIY